MKPIIVTGDHKLTTKAVAEKIGFRINEKNILEGKDLDNLSDKEFRFLMFLETIGRFDNAVYDTEEYIISKFGRSKEEINKIIKSMVEKKCLEIIETPEGEKIFKVLSAEYRYPFLGDRFGPQDDFDGPGYKITERSYFLNTNTYQEEIEREAK